MDMQALLGVMEELRMQWGAHGLGLALDQKRKGEQQLVPAEIVLGLMATILVAVVVWSAERLLWEVRLQLCR